MSAAVSSVPRLTFFANDGTPLNGGLVYTYAAGTLTPKTFYSDEAKTVPVSNPIVLNAAGRPQASAIDTTEVNLYFTGSAKFVVKNSLGSTLYTADNIEEVAVAATNTALAFPVTVTGGTSGGVPYFSSTTVLAASGLLTASDVVLGGGAGNPPVSQGTKAANTVMAGPVSGSAAIVTARALDPLDIGSNFYGYVTTQFNATTNVTYADVPALSFTLVAGKTYTFRAVLICAIDASGGMKIQTAGTATATTFAATTSTISSAGGQLITQTGVTGAACKVTIDGYIVVNGGGVLKLQAAQAVSSGTTSILVGSFLAFNV
jgi:hypothetical protein